MRKKLVTLATVLALCMVLAPPATAEGVSSSDYYDSNSAVLAEPKLSVLVDGTAVQWTDAEPFIDENNRTMVPLRAVGDALGLTVDWDNSTRTASFSDGTKTLYFPIGSNTARTSDGSTITMDTAAVIVNNRTYAPVRYLAEFFGFAVGWGGNTNTVTISSPLMMARQYENEALERARNEWAAKAYIDPMRLFVDGMTGIALADSYESSACIHGGIPAIITSAIFGLSSALPASGNTQLNYQLLTNSLANYSIVNSASDVERVEAELQWGRPSKISYEDEIDDQGNARTYEASFSYDGSGNVIREDISVYGTSVSGVTLDKNGNVIHEDVSDYRRMLASILYSYNNDNQCLSKIIDFNDGAAIVERRNEYDVKGRITKVSIFSDGESYLFNWEYNDVGDLIAYSRILRFDGADTIQEYYTFAWNENGSLASMLYNDGSSDHEVIPHQEIGVKNFEIEFELAGERITCSGQFDEEGRISAWRSEGQGHSSSISYIFADKDGVSSLDEIYETAENSQRNSFNYDSYGNILSCTTSTKAGETVGSTSYTYQRDLYGRCMSVVTKADGGREYKLIFDY